jgi:hypothetical protein
VVGGQARQRTGVLMRYGAVMIVAVLVVTALGQKRGSSSATQRAATQRVCVVIAGDRGKVFLSPDGLTWSRRSSGTDQELQGVAIDAKRIVVVHAASAGTLPITSSVDRGRSWRKATAKFPLKDALDLRAVATDGNGWVAVGADGRILYSADGQRWRSAHSPTSQYLGAVAANGKRWVATGLSEFPWSHVILTSRDGLHWRIALNDSALWTTAVGWNGSQWVVGALGSANSADAGSGYFLTSNDGTTWTPHKSFSDPQTQVGLFANDLAWNGHEWLTVTLQGVWSSVDGVNWTRRDAPTSTIAFPVSKWFTSIAWAGERWVAVPNALVGFEPQTIVGAYASTNGTDWTQTLTTPSGEALGGSGAC